MPKYYDNDGNEVTLYQLVKTEPEWATVQISIFNELCREAHKIFVNELDLYGPNDHKDFMMRLDRNINRSD
jgi:hypothetical protein